MIATSKLSSMIILEPKEEIWHARPTNADLIKNRCLPIRDEYENVVLIWLKKNEVKEEE